MLFREFVHRRDEYLNIDDIVKQLRIIRFMSFIMFIYGRFCNF